LGTTDIKLAIFSKTHRQ